MEYRLGIRFRSTICHSMFIADAETQGKGAWNSFVRSHYPPIGAFLQSWEWGEFQKAQGKSISRWYVYDGRNQIAAFTLVRYPLPLGFCYGYVPRGPVIAPRKKLKDSTPAVLEAIRKWVREKHPTLLFVRLEPPVKLFPGELNGADYRFPKYYVQPRYNTAVALGGSESDITGQFHPSTRSNLGRAKRRGVEVELQPVISTENRDAFERMMTETIARNGGVNVYPSKSYFKNLESAMPPIKDRHDTVNATLGYFIGYTDGKPAACHLVIFFGNTATYLYGAANTETLASKVTTYLHFQGMLEAKKRGIKHYDIGGIDVTKWPSLTAFKRQFRGEEFAYIGLVDVPTHPFLYRCYNIMRALRRRQSL